MSAAHTIGLLVLGAALMCALLLVAGVRRERLWHRAFRHLLFYTVDAAAAMVGFVLAFGLTVHSWFWLVAVLILSRFVMHMLHQAWFATLAKEDAKKEPA